METIRKLTGGGKTGELNLSSPLFIDLTRECHTTENTGLALLNALGHSVSKNVGGSVQHNTFFKISEVQWRDQMASGLEYNPTNMVEVVLIQNIEQLGDTKENFEE
ncbi:hypothetical protein [Halorientalis marina]|uniref:hypothetical protein n=1 Tax=Halorientalis marina TaxID=2931976 RepID=UPI001FF2F86F|nr:hypothetical protein [Halorientalis marina]